MSTLAKKKTQKTMEATIDKEQIRKALRILVVQEPDFVKQLLHEISKELHPDDEFEKSQQTKRLRLEQIVNEDFAEYDAVFRKLA